MSCQKIGLGVLFASAILSLGPVVNTQVRPTTTAVLYEGARLIPGDGRPPIASSAMLVEGGVITRIGTAGNVTAPAETTRIDLTGKTVMPTLVNAHGHPGFQRGLTYSADNFTRDTVLDDLNRALYFGVAAVLSQGIEKGDVTFQIRADQEAGTLGGALLRVAGRGIGAPNAGPGAAAYAGIAYEVATRDEGRKAVQEIAARKADVVKIWVDDRNGRAPRLPKEIFTAIIDEGHKHGLKVNAHVFYHDDAVDLVNAGIDGLVHLVRDREMDDALVAAIVKRNVYVMPNLSGRRGLYTDVPPWLKAGMPLMKLVQESIPQPVIDRIRKSYDGRDPKAVELARTQYAILERSTAKLARANARITLGCDTGLEDYLFGFAEQLELESMVRAGMTPMQVIVAATSRAAEYLELDRMGTLAVGKEADFLVLDANPLDDITNTQRISGIYLHGVEVDRASMRARLTHAATN